MEGPPPTGSGLYPLRRQSRGPRRARFSRLGKHLRGQTGSTPVPSTNFFAPVVQRTRIVGLHPTDAGSTPERRTILNCRISSKVEPAVDNREVLVRFQHPAPSCSLNVGDWQRWLMHSPLKRDKAGSIPASPTRFAGLADVDMHSPFKRDEVGSIPTSRTNSYEEAA